MLQLLGLCKQLMEVATVLDLDFLSPHIIPDWRKIFSQHWVSDCTLDLDVMPSSWWLWVIDKNLELKPLDTTVNAQYCALLNKLQWHCFSYWSGRLAKEAFDRLSPWLCHHGTVDSVSIGNRRSQWYTTNTAGAHRPGGVGASPCSFSQSCFQSQS